MNQHMEHANKIVKHHMWLSASAGVIPVPLLDISIITGIQLKMIAKLSRHYKIPFARQAARSVVTTLGGTIVISSASRGIVGSSIKAIPFIGSLTSPFVMPAFAGAMTYALGMVFIQHFESGGTFLDLDPEKTKSFFESKYNEKMKQKQIRNK